MGTKYTILVIDDDKSTHYIVKTMLAKRYSLIHALNAQQGINVLSEKKVDLVLSDIHMPGMSGLEFLNVLVKDANKKHIPVLIMTSLPSVEKEQQALDLGAQDFLKKEMFTYSPLEVRHRIEMKLVSNLTVPNLPKKVSEAQNAVVKEMISAVAEQEFDKVCQSFCEILKKNFQFDHVSFWWLNKEEPSLKGVAGIEFQNDYTPNDLYSEKTFHKFVKSRKPYYSNNVLNDGNGVNAEFSKEKDLGVEIGVPMFCITESDLIKHEMKIPAKTKIYGYLLLKRSSVISTKEYSVISKLAIRCSSMLWRIKQEKG